METRLFPSSSFDCDVSEAAANLAHNTTHLNSVDDLFGEGASARLLGFVRW